MPTVLCVCPSDPSDCYSPISSRPAQMFCHAQCRLSAFARFAGHSSSDHSKEKVVTFLGRITMQKGPEYFVEAAALVLKRTRNIRFVMAGSGDMLDAMINLAAERGIADRFHFPGFQRGRQVYEAYKTVMYS